MTRAAPGAKLVDKKTNEPRKGMVRVLMRAALMSPGSVRTEEAKNAAR